MVVKRNTQAAAADQHGLYRFIGGKHHAALLAVRGRGKKFGGDGGFAAACRAYKKRACSARNASAKNFIELRNTAGQHVPVYIFYVMFRRDQAGIDMQAAFGDLVIVLPFTKACSAKFEHLELAAQ